MLPDQGVPTKPEGLLATLSRADLRQPAYAGCSEKLGETGYDFPS